MELNNTIEMMNSTDFKERFRAEYFQLDNRITGLSNMLDKYRKGTLEFTPKCTLKILDGQLNAMKIYRTHLIERARIEDISLEEIAEPTTVPPIDPETISESEIKSEETNTKTKK